MIQHPKVGKWFIPQALRMAIKFLELFLFYYNRSKRFLHLEKKDGISLRIRLENLYINSHIIQKKIDWLHFGFATVALRRENIAGAIRAKMSTSLRGYDINIYPLTNKGCYDTLWKKVDKIHSISKYLLKKAEKDGLSKEKPNMIIKPSIDIDYFNGLKKCKSFDFSENPIQILTVARLNWVKGLEHSIEGLAILRNRGIRFNYNIIGEGVECERLKLAISQMGLEDCVQLLGFIPHNSLYNYYQKAHIYLQYSLEEGFCNSTLEAQAMGLLTIVSDAGGLVENVVNEKTGWIIKKSVPRQLARTIEDIIKIDISKLNQISSDAMQRVRLGYALQNQEKQFCEFFNEDY